MFLGDAVVLHGTLLNASFGCINSHKCDDDGDEAEESKRVFHFHSVLLHQREALHLLINQMASEVEF